MTIDLEAIRGRLSTGETLPQIAPTLGVTWQRLSKALRGRARLDDDSRPIPPAQNTHNAHNPAPATDSLNRIPDHVVPSDAATSEPDQPRASLADRYRPRTLADIAGQAPSVALLRAFAAAPYPAAFVFAGETGTGKTSAALALARDLGCVPDECEFGGIYTISAGDQTAENVRDQFGRLWYRPRHGSGWKVLIVNEADRLGRPAENVWLDRLEAIPAKSVVIFTTNEAERLAQRFMDRCTVLKFESRADVLEQPGVAYVQRIWKTETGRMLPDKAASELFHECVVDGHFSFRRAVAVLQEKLLRNGA